MVDPLALAYAATAGPAVAGAATHIWRNTWKSQNAARTAGTWCGKWGCQDNPKTCGHGTFQERTLSQQQFGK